MDLDLGRGLVVSASEIAVETSRAGGPGGQHVNKTETRVTLRFSVSASSAFPEGVRARLLSRLAPRLTKQGELLVSVSEHRERPRNLTLAYERMQGILRRALVEPKFRRSTRPSRGAKERRLKDKRLQSDKKAARRSPPRD